MSTEEQFLKNVQRHKMKVVLDTPPLRYLQFRRPGSGIYWIDIVTTPGAITIMSDCGSYTLRRLEDMFEFIRTDSASPRALAEPNRLFVNPSYWAEKVVARDTHSAQTEFCPSTFKENVLVMTREWAESELGDDDQARQALLADVKDSVLRHVDDGEHSAYRAAMDFRSEAHPRFSLESIVEYKNQRYTFSYLWCCYALSWAVKQYDQHQSATENAKQAVSA